MLERMLGKGNTPPSMIIVQAGTEALEINMAISQKIRKQPSSRASNTTFGQIYPKDAKLYHKDMCSTMLITALFDIART